MKSWLLWYASILWRYDAIRDEENNWATWCPHMRGEIALIGLEVSRF